METNTAANQTFRIDFRFNTYEAAMRFASKAEGHMVVVLGDADDAAPYWVMTPANAARAMKAGYEIPY